MNQCSRSFRAARADYPLFMSFVTDFVRRYTDDGRVLNDISISLDEVFSNVEYYSSGDRESATEINVELHCTDGELTIVFSDFGMPFNPLEKPAPSLEENRRKKVVGGFGIFLVRRLMDSVSYSYDNKNILTLKKKLLEDYV